MIGNTTPRYSYSLAGWCALERHRPLSMVWQGVGRRDWYPAKESGYFWGQYGRPYSMALPWQNSDRCADANQNTRRLLAASGRLLGTAARVLILSQPNTRYLQEAPYVRLKNLTIDYTFPQADGHQDRSSRTLRNLRFGREPADLHRLSKSTRRTTTPRRHLRRRLPTFRSTKTRRRRFRATATAIPSCVRTAIGLSITF